MATRNEVRVGCLWSESGWCWLDCRPMSMGVKFWVADTNAKGGMYVPEVGKKLPVKLVTADDRSYPPHAVELYRKMIDEDDVDVIVSGGSSEIQKELLPLTEAAGILNINAGAPDDELFEGTRYHLLSTATGLRGMASNPARPRFWKANGLTRIAQIYPDNGGWPAYSSGLKDAVEAEGLTMALRWIAPMQTEWSTLYGALTDDFSDWSGIIDRVEAAEPDALVIAFPAPAQYQLLRELKRRDLWYPYIEMTYGQAMTKSGLGPEDLEYLFAIGAFTPVVKREDSAETPKVTVGYTRDEFDAHVRVVMPHHATGAVGLSHYLALALWEYLVNQAGSLDGAAIMSTALANPAGMANMLGPIEFLPNGMRRLTESSDMSIGQMVRNPETGDLQTMTVAPEEQATARAILDAPPWSRRQPPWFAKS